jgi:hypothetical protein
MRLASTSNLRFLFCRTDSSELARSKGAFREPPTPPVWYAPKVFASLPRGERGGYCESEFKAAMDLLLFREFIKASRQDPDTGERWRSARLVRIKQG